MIIFDTQFAVHGVGSGNAPALYRERRTPKNGFLFILLCLFSCGKRKRDNGNRHFYDR